MTVIKRVIEGISKPLTYICNLSFKTGIFPNKMKIAKVLGPKLFILNINDLTQKPVLFADDTNLFCSGNDLQKPTLDVLTELSKLKSWFNINKLSLNLSKTKIMHFGNWKSNILIKVLLDDVAIEKVNEIRFLGVTIDDKISWNSHVKHVQ